jgi:hypothetical protein
MRANAYYLSALRTTSTLAAPTTNRFICHPIFIPNTITALALIVRVNTLTTSGVARMGIYNSGSNGEPSSLLLDAGTISYTTSNTNYSITINQSLTSGWYWVGIVVQSGSSVWDGYENGVNNGAISTQRAFSVSSGNAVIGYYRDSVTGALPAVFTSSVVSNQGGPIVKIGT